METNTLRLRTEKGLETLARNRIDSISKLKNAGQFFYLLALTLLSSFTFFATIAVADPLEVDAAITNVSCNGGNNGTIVLEIEGDGPFIIQWAHGPSDASLTGLAAGSYEVTVTDWNSGNGNGSESVTKTFIISEPAALNLSSSVTDLGCGEVNTGSINLAVSGGVAPYTYAWSNNSTTEDLSQLAAGVYTVIITDANGCSQSATIDVKGKLMPVADFDVDVIEGPLGSTVNFINNSSNAVAYEWKISGAGNYTVSAPTHQFQQPGDYSVTLVVANADGCTDSIIKSNLIHIYTLLQGDVKDVNGNAVTGGLVHALKMNNAGSELDTVGTSQIDADGSFRFKDLAQGDYLVLALPDPAIYPTLLPTYLGNEIRWSSAAPLTFDGFRDDIRIDLREQKVADGKGRVFGIITEGAMKGIRGPGEPIKGINVSAIDKNTAELVRFAVTDDFGNFNITGLPEGTFQLLVDMPGIPMDMSSQNEFVVTEHDTLSEAMIKIDSNLITVSITSIISSADEKKISSIVEGMYPNPAVNDLYVTINNTTAGAEVIVKIYDLKGAEVLSTENISLRMGGNLIKLDTQDLQSGIYMMGMISDNNPIAGMNKLMISK